MNTMHVDVVTLTAVILCFPLLTLCDPLYVLSAPNLLRVGSSENVFVEAQDYSGKNLNVRIFVKNYPKKNQELLSKSVTLTADNNFQNLTDIKILRVRDYFNDDPLEKQYVYLQARFPTVTLEKVVMVSFQSGYIFVQTDKPIYTPTSTERGIKNDNFVLPELASSGVWKLIAKFTHTPQKNFTTEFEVMAYVLPTFEVTLNTRKPFFYVNEDSLKVDISAKYLLGNSVRGTAFVVFGVIENEKKISIAASLQRVQIFDGEGEAELTTQMIKANFPDIQQLVGKSLYISVSVLTETGSEMVEAHKKGIQIVTSPYTIQFRRTPHFFKPGMPYDVSVYVTNPDQTPAKNVKVEVNPGGVMGQTGDNGIVKVTVNSQEGSSILETSAKTKNPQLSDDQQAVKKMTAQAYKGSSKNYLHIDIKTAELQIGNQMKVSLNLEHSPGVINPDITYMILSKGQIVKVGRSKRSGQFLVTLSLLVTKDMVPSFRFVAYYHVGSSEVVSDSVWVDVKDTCLGTLKVEMKDPAQNSPGKLFKLKITGDPGAKVALVAVDKGVYVLNDKNRLTQTKIWDVIEKHDTGCTAGSGKDSMGVFTDAGLMFESNTAGGTNTRTNNECPVPSKRKRRAQSLLQITTTLGEEDDFEKESEDVMVRTQFPESWLWKEIDLPACPPNSLCVETSTLTTETLKDSITTWQITAISLSKTFAVPLIIIPMELNEQWIEVEAHSFDSKDKIMKKLKVVPEGVLTEARERTEQINPSKHPGGLQVVSVRSNIPPRKVPNTPATTVITVIGQEMTRTVEQAISGHFMGQLIVQPYGCGEQNMIRMTLPLIATHYLDSINQWEAVGMERRNEAINHIRTGYKAELAFRKSDGSYGVYSNTPSSTWLTAYAAKVFAMASDLIVIEENVLCSALHWLATNKQLPDGRFKEDQAVYLNSMVGGVHKDADASLTAFVLIAMQEGSKICNEPNLQSSMKRAVDYLLLKVHSLTSAYDVAMTSYALALAGKLNKDILKRHSTESKDGIFWKVPGEHHHSLGATGYAVLALVNVKDFESAGQAVRWLGMQQTHYGGYGTTQATSIVFQAVAEYRTQVKQPDISLNLDLAVEGRKDKTTITIQPTNIHISRSDKFDITKSFNITAQGTGVAMLSVFSVYYALPEEKDYDCNVFDLSVQMVKEPAVSYDGASESYQITIEYIFKDPSKNSGMSILDIGLLTGFKVDERDLSKLLSGKDKYIQNFELNKELSERGSLIIYIDKISNKEKDRLVFSMHKMNEVGMLQPAGITVYEYYAPDKRCVKFYHPNKKDGSLNRLCHEGLCQCVEVYKTRVLEMGFSLHADIYNMTIEKVVKQGSDPDVEGNIRSFLAHPFCRDSLKFEKGKTYLIMGQTKNLPRISGKLRYHLGEDTWIEYWPTDKESQTEEHRKRYIGITSLADELLRFGCST
ncbi:complement C3-like protein [Labeo rohita]|uniref:Complement C3-like protein n=1 Tax=Labeo rohita TaxID=84645 RepID=A0A498MD14_LABRO|nr:complement C3-like protein [Labeo rohita]